MCTSRQVSPVVASRSLPLNQTSRVIYQEQIWLGSTKIFTCKIQRNLAKNRATPIKHKALLNSLAGCSAGLKKQRRRQELLNGRGRSSVGGRGSKGNCKPPTWTAPSFMDTVKVLPLSFLLQVQFKAESELETKMHLHTIICTALYTLSYCKTFIFLPVCAQLIYMFALTKVSIA